MSEEEKIRWQKIPLRLGDVGDLTVSRERVIREYARSQHYETLAGFHWHMRREELNYYDVIRVYYGG